MRFGTHQVFTEIVDERLSSQLLGSLFSSLIVCQMFHASNWLDHPPAYQQLYYLQTSCTASLLLLGWFLHGHRGQYVVSYTLR